MYNYSSLDCRILLRNLAALNLFRISQFERNGFCCLFEHRACRVLVPSESESGSVVSDSLRPRGLYSPWCSPGQNTGVGGLSLLQVIFPTEGSNPGLPHCRRILYQLSHKGSPLVPQPAIKPMPLVVQVQSLNCWTVREVPEKGSSLSRTTLPADHQFISP